MSTSRRWTTPKWQERLAQFVEKSLPLWFTRAPTFEEKSRLFPGATFVVGADTLVRIGQAKYYGNDPAAAEAAFANIAKRGCRFLVFGRVVDGKFQALSDLALPDSLRKLCDEVPADEFREDISSTELQATIESTTDRLHSLDDFDAQQRQALPQHFGRQIAQRQPALQQLRRFGSQHGAVFVERAEAVGQFEQIAGQLIGAIVGQHQIERFGELQAASAKRSFGGMRENEVARGLFAPLRPTAFALGKNSATRA